MSIKSLLQVTLVVSLAALATLLPAAQAQATSNGFNFDYTIRAFEEAMADKEAISLEHYLNGFRESQKFLRSFGSICSRAVDELEEKIGLLQGYRDAEERRSVCISAYLTIQSAVNYETRHKLLRDRKRPSGARAILWLNRSLELLATIMTNLSRIGYDAGTSSAVDEAYSGTLGKHHSWPVRVIASLVMKTLPRKRTVVERLFGQERSRDERFVNDQLRNLANVAWKLFRLVDKFYEANNIKDL